MRATQQRFHESSGLAPNTLLLHATHTHVAPAATSLLMEVAEPGFVQNLQNAVLEAALAALARLEPVTVFAEQGHLDEMGWNRRAMLQDGTSLLYGHSQTPGFIGMEGPRDPALPVLWTQSASGEITGVLVNFATHPNCLEGDHFYSADLPGAARKHIRRLLGGKTQVLYLTGAAGNTAPSLLDPFDAAQPWRGQSGVERSGLYLAGETAKVIASGLHPMENPQLELQTSVVNIPLRPWPEPGTLTNAWPFPVGGQDYYDKAAREWPRWMAEHNPYGAHLNVLRIGDAAICTNPAELFVEFGLQIREKSPALVTFVTELTDGFAGYVPTPLAFSRGGYETWCAPTSRLDPGAGDAIVAATHQLLQATFPQAEHSPD